jgi:hypothetical protein
MGRNDCKCQAAAGSAFGPGCCVCAVCFAVAVAVALAVAVADDAGVCHSMRRVCGVTTVANQRQRRQRRQQRMRRVQVQSPHFGRGLARGLAAEARLARGRGTSAARQGARAAQVSVLGGARLFARCRPPLPFSPSPACACPAWPYQVLRNRDYDAQIRSLSFQPLASSPAVLLSLPFHPPAAAVAFSPILAR